MYKIPSLYIERIENPNFYNVRRPCLSLNTLRGSETTLNPEILTKSVEITLQQCVDVANEYLQAYNTGADAENHLFCSLHQCKCAGYTMFLFAFGLSS